MNIACLHGREGQGLNGGNLYVIDLVYFEANGNIRTSAGQSPRGFNLESFEADLKQYQEALSKAWLRRPADKSKPWRAFRPSVKISACKPKLDPYNDTVLVLMKMVFYWCIHAPKYTVSFPKSRSDSIIIYKIAVHVVIPRKSLLKMPCCTCNA